MTLGDFNTTHVHKKNKDGDTRSRTLPLSGLSSLRPSGTVSAAMGEESIRQEVWEGKIPVCFSVAVEEVGINLRGETAVPEPCYVRPGVTVCARSYG